MTVAVDSTQPTNRAGTSDELTTLAEVTGVLSLVPFTERQHVPLDQTGGLEVIEAVLRHKTAANPIVSSTATATATASTRPTFGARLQRLGRRLASWAASVIQTARDATAWVTSTVDAARVLERRRHVARHRVQSHWFGRERSTAEFTGRLHRNSRNARLTSPPSPEGDLPRLHPADSLYWVGWLERLTEVMRDHDETLHPTNGHRFVCS